MRKLRKKVYTMCMWRIDFLVDYMLFSDILQSRIL
jgi:hypothetical protein